MRRFLKNQHINKNLTIFGPIGLKYWFDMQARLHGSWFGDNRPRLQEMHKSEDEWAGLCIKSFPTVHMENSIAFKFIEDKKSFFYSSDTDYDNALVGFAKNSDLAILECSHRDENPQKGHLTPHKAADFINNAAIDKTVLTHIYPENDTSDLLTRVKNFSSKNIHIGYDSMKLML